MTFFYTVTLKYPALASKIRTLFTFSFIEIYLYKLY